MLPKRKRVCKTSSWVYIDSSNSKLFLSLHICVFSMKMIWLICLARSKHTYTDIEIRSKLKYNCSGDRDKLRKQHAMGTNVYWQTFLHAFIRCFVIEIKISRHRVIMVHQMRRVRDLRNIAKIFLFEIGFTSIRLFEENITLLHTYDIGKIIGKIQ